MRRHTLCLSVFYQSTGGGEKKNQVRGSSLPEAVVHLMTHVDDAPTSGVCSGSKQIMMERTVMLKKDKEWACNNSSRPVFLLGQSYADYTVASFQRQSSPCYVLFLRFLEALFLPLRQHITTLARVSSIWGH